MESTVMESFSGRVVAQKFFFLRFHESRLKRCQSELFHNHIFNVGLIIERCVHEWNAGLVIASDFCLGALQVFRCVQAEMFVKQSIRGEIEIRTEKEIADFQLGFVYECQIGCGQEIGDDLFNFAAHPVTRVSHVFPALLPFIEAESGSAFWCIYNLFSCRGAAWVKRNTRCC